MAAPMIGPSPVIVLYTRPGCGLCVETRALLDGLLAERVAGGRPTAPIEERDITTNEEWERAFLVEIPVVDIGELRYPLATSPARLRRFLEEALEPVNG
jgi:hypothetical protein